MNCFVTGILHRHDRRQPQPDDRRLRSGKPGQRPWKCIQAVGRGREISRARES